MNLDEAQQVRVREWIDQGLKVAEVQTRLAEELGLRLTYMEARLLLDDLKLRPRDPVPAPKPVASPLTTPGTAGPTASGGSPGAGPSGGLGSGAPPSGANPFKLAPLPAAGGGAPGRVAVSVDEITRPGSLVSGKVTFSDGQAADWQMDQYGRLAVMPKQQGYKPSPGDVREFQAELEAQISRLGY